MIIWDLLSKYPFIKGNHHFHEHFPKSFQYLSVSYIYLAKLQGVPDKYDLPWFCSVFLAMKRMFDEDKMLINTCMCKEVHYLTAMSYFFLLYIFLLISWISSLVKADYDNKVLANKHWSKNLGWTVLRIDARLDNRFIALRPNYQLCILGNKNKLVYSINTILMMSNWVLKMNKMAQIISIM